MSTKCILRNKKKKENIKRNTDQGEDNMLMMEMPIWLDYVGYDENFVQTLDDDSPPDVREAWEKYQEERKRLFEEKKILYKRKFGIKKEKGDADDE